MSFNAQIIDQWVEGLVERIGDRLRDEVGVRNDPAKLKSTAFVFLVAKTLLDIDDDVVLDGIVEGGGDFGIDAVYFTPPENGEFLITIFQGKYSQNMTGNSGFPENSIIKVIAALRVLLDPQKAFIANNRLTGRIEDVRSLIREDAIPLVRVVLCSNGVKWNAESDRRIEDAGYGEQVTWEYAGPEDIIRLKRAPKPIDVVLRLSGKAVVDDYDFMRAMVGRMSALELARLFEEQGDVLLQRNIRRYLGLSGRINEEIASTLRDSEQRKKFYFYNNGITLVCNTFRHNALAEQNWSVQVKGLQVINGGQTSKTIQHIAKEIGDEIDNAQVLVRLYELPDDDDSLVQRITLATNSQNPVDLRDLRSNDERQQRLTLSIQELGYFYRRKRGSAPPQANEITNAVAAEAILAIWRRRPHQARFLANEHFGKLYELIFSNDLNGAQLVCAVLLFRIAENHRKRAREQAPAFLQYGSRFIAMSMGRFLLNDLGVAVERLNHQNFAQAKEFIDSKGEAYFHRAMDAVASALNRLHHGETVSLQKLSATFRRHDLIEELLSVE
jgi:hypothetical protein